MRSPTQRQKLLDDLRRAGAIARRVQVEMNDTQTHCDSCGVPHCEDLLEWKVAQALNAANTKITKALELLNGSRNATKEVSHGEKSTDAENA